MTLKRKAVLLLITTFIVGLSLKSVNAEVSGWMCGLSGMWLGMIGAMAFYNWFVNL